MEWRLKVGGFCELSLKYLIFELKNLWVYFVNGFFINSYICYVEEVFFLVDEKFVVIGSWWFLKGLFCSVFRGYVVLVFFLRFLDKEFLLLGGCFGIVEVVFFYILSRWKRLLFFGES